MTKTKTPAAAAPAFTLGQTVAVFYPRNNDTDFHAVGTLTGASKGWYVVEMDAASALLHGRDKVSVRLPSLTAVAPAGEPVSRETTDGLEGEVEDDEETEVSLTASKMAEALRRARVRYVKTKRPDGAASADCGDKLAQTLRDLEPLEVAALADKAVEVPAGFHAAKYAKLNNGQIRMNSGNRVRAALKNAIEDEDHDEIARLEALFGWTSEGNEEMGEEGNDE